MRPPILRLIVVSFSLVGLGLCAGGAQAVATIAVRQEGAHVVFTGSGSLDLRALAYQQTGPLWYNYFSTKPSDAEFQVGAVPGSPVDLYGCLQDACISGPSSFGRPRERYSFPDFGSGDAFGYWDFDGNRGLVVPSGYVSGSPLSGSSTFLNRTLASMGVKLGTSEYSWGLGDTADSIRITTEAPTPVPLAGAASLLHWSRRLRRQGRRHSRTRVASMKLWG